MVPEIFAFLGTDTARPDFKITTVWIHKSVGRHKTSSTVLGLASALNLIVVTKRFR